MPGGDLSPAVSECRSVEQCRGSVGAVLGHSRGSVGAVSGQCRLILVSECRVVSSSVGAVCTVGQCRGFLTEWASMVSVEQCRSVGVSECRSVGVSSSVGVSECRVGVSLGARVSGG
jgi:hypothetical protein